METSSSPQIEGTVGRWTKLEHENFLKGLREYGKDWKRIGALIQTRTVVQVRTHAQKYFLASSKRSNKEHASAGKSNASPAAAAKETTLVSTKKSQSANSNKRNHSISPPLSKRTKHVPSPAPTVEEDDNDDDGMGATLTSATSTVSPTMGPEKTDSLKLSFLVCLDMLPPLVDSYSPTSGSEGGSPKSFIGHGGESLLFSNSPSLSLDDDDNESNDNRHRDDEDDLNAVIAANMASVQVNSTSQQQQHHLMDDVETLTHTALPVTAVGMMDNGSNNAVTAAAAAAPAPACGGSVLDNMDAFNIGDLFPKWIETNILLLDDDHRHHLDLS